MSTNIIALHATATGLVAAWATEDSVVARRYASLAELLSYGTHYTYLVNREGALNCSLWLELMGLRQQHPHLKLTSIHRSGRGVEEALQERLETRIPDMLRAIELCVGGAQ